MNLLTTIVYEFSSTLFLIFPDDRASNRSVVIGTGYKVSTGIGTLALHLLYSSDAFERVPLLHLNSPSD